MITNKNWKDYACYQPDSMKDGDTATIFFMSVKTEPSQSLLAIERALIPVTDITLTEDELVEQINLAFNSFTHRIVVRRDREERKIDLKQACDEVAKRIRRKSANTNIGNVWFYKGSNPFDAPLFVTSYNDKFYLFKHPNFDDYGFIVE